MCLDSTAVRFPETPIRITTNHMGSFFFTSTDHVHSPHADIMPFYNIHILLLGNFTTVNVSSGPLSGKVIKVCLTLTISIYFCPNHLSSPEFHNLANKKITNPHILHSATSSIVTMPQKEASERPVPQSLISDSGCFDALESPNAQSTTFDPDNPFDFSTLLYCQCANRCHGSFNSPKNTLHSWTSYYTLSHLPLSNCQSSSSSQKLNVASPVNTPRRSLLSDLLSNQAAPTRLEQNANRRRMLKSMRRYSVDASEMDFTLGGRPSSRGSPLTTISSEGEGALLIDSHQGFNATPTVRYLRNPCHAAVKTKLMPSAYRGSLVRRSSNGTVEDEETPDYFASEDRVW